LKKTRDTDKTIRSDNFITRIYRHIKKMGLILSQNKNFVHTKEFKSTNDEDYLNGQWRTYKNYVNLFEIYGIHYNIEGYSEG